MCRGRTIAHRAGNRSEAPGEDPSGRHPTDAQADRGKAWHRTSIGSECQGFTSERIRSCDLRQLEINPVEHTAIKRVPTPETRFLTLEEAQRLFEAVAEDRFESLDIIAAVYGLRRGECLGLRWVDVGTAARTIQIRQQVIVVENQPTVTSLKTETRR